MSVRDLDLRLSGTGEPDGQIALSDLVAISKALQDLSTGIGRYVVGMEGPGRTPRAVDRLTTLRLRGVQPRSTRLLLSVGDPDALPVDVPLEDEVANLFWEIVRGVSEGVRPAWVSPPVARSALAFRDALANAAGQVEVRRGDGVRVEFVPGEARRDIWVIPDRKVTAELSEATGRLEAVDLHTNKFRIRDDVGNGIDLEDVVDADAVAPLVGQRTKGVGRAVFDCEGS